MLIIQSLCELITVYTFDCWRCPPICFYIIKYLGAAASDDGSKLEVFSRIAQATANLVKLKPVWRDKNILLSQSGN